MTATPNALPAAGALAALAIRHALVYDGTGRPPVTADVIIKDGLVAALDTTAINSSGRLPAANNRCTSVSTFDSPM